jgi:hypothetical protein
MNSTNFIRDLLFDFAEASRKGGPDLSGCDDDTLNRVVTAALTTRDDLARGIRAIGSAIRTAPHVEQEGEYQFAPDLGALLEVLADGLAAMTEIADLCHTQSYRRALRQPPPENLRSA